MKHHVTVNASGYQQVRIGSSQLGSPGVGVVVWSQSEWGSVTSWATVALVSSVTSTLVLRGGRRWALQCWVGNTTTSSPRIRVYPSSKVPRMITSGTFDEMIDEPSSHALDGRCAVGGSNAMCSSPARLTSEEVRWNHVGAP